MKNTQTNERPHPNVFLQTPIQGETTIRRSMEELYTLQCYPLVTERAALAKSTRLLRTALFEAWTRAQQQSKPETYLAATLRFSDLDMIRCLESATRLYRKSLSKVAAAIVSWKTAFKQVSVEIVDELQAHDIPIEGVYRLIHGQSWHQDPDQSGDPESHADLSWVRQGGDYLAHLIEQLQRVEDALGQDNHLQSVYR